MLQLKGEGIPWLQSIVVPWDEVSLSAKPSQNTLCKLHLSLGILVGLVPGSPMDPQICGCSSPLYKMM